MKLHGSLSHSETVPLGCREFSFSNDSFEAVSDNCYAKLYMRNKTRPLDSAKDAAG